CAPVQASMPMRHGGRLASRASTWPRDHFWRNTRAPRRSWPTMWNEFLPISMPITASLLLSFSDMACSFVFRCPLASLARWQGLEHGRTIPFSAVSGGFLLRCTALTPQDLLYLVRDPRTEAKF